MYGSTHYFCYRYGVLKITVKSYTCINECFLWLILHILSVSYLIFTILLLICRLTYTSSLLFSLGIDPMKKTFPLFALKISPSQFRSIAWIVSFYTLLQSDFSNDTYYFFPQMLSSTVTTFPTFTTCKGWSWTVIWTTVFLFSRSLLITGSRRFLECMFISIRRLHILFVFITLDSTDLLFLL